MALTVCIVSYGYGHLAAHAIESVLNQTQQPDKIIFIDDGKGDCRHIPKLYLDIDFDERKENLGITESFNSALYGYVDTTEVMFMGADNWLHPLAIELMSAQQQDINSSDMYVVGAGEDAWKDYPEIQDDYPIWRLQGSAHGCSIYNVQWARDVGGYETSSNSEKNESDSMLFNKMIDAGATLGYVRRPLIYWRKHLWNSQ